MQRVSVVARGVGCVLKVIASSMSCTRVVSVSNQPVELRAQLDALC